MVINPSTSREQREAGMVLTNALSSSLGVKLKEKQLRLEGGATVEIDGYSDEPPILCEAWAHYGEPKGSQPFKVMTDALKLIFTEKCLGRRFSKILLFSNEKARKPFTGKGWKAQVLRSYEIETRVFPLPEGQIKEVIEAQKRQNGWQH